MTKASLKVNDVLAFGFSLNDNCLVSVSSPDVLLSGIGKLFLFSKHFRVLGDRWVSSGVSPESKMSDFRKDTRGTCTAVVSRGVFRATSCRFSLSGELNNDSFGWRGGVGVWRRSSATFVGVTELARRLSWVGVKLCIMMFLKSVRISRVRMKRPVALDEVSES